MYEKGERGLLIPLGVNAKANNVRMHYCLWTEGSTKMIISRGRRKRIKHGEGETGGGGEGLSSFLLAKKRRRVGLMNNAGGESRLKQLPGVALFQKLHRQIFREIKTLYRVPELPASVADFSANFYFTVLQFLTLNAFVSAEWKRF